MDRSNRSNGTKKGERGEHFGTYQVVFDSPTRCACPGIVKLSDGASVVIETSSLAYGHAWP